jgi:hypothetical protein
MDLKEETSQKMCGVKISMANFDRKHPDLAGKKDFANLDVVVGFTSEGSPMNAAENFWYQSQYHAKEDPPTVKECEVKIVMANFDRKNPELANIKDFSENSSNVIVGYTATGSPMNAAEDFWFQSQCHVPETLTDKKICEVKLVMDNFDRENPELAKIKDFSGINFDEIVGYTSNGTPMNAAEAFWYHSQGHAKMTSSLKVSTPGPSKICDVKQAMEMFDRKYPELAKMNAMEAYWCLSQGHPKERPDSDPDDENNDQTFLPEPLMFKMDVSWSESDQSGFDTADSGCNQSNNSSTPPTTPTSSMTASSSGSSFDHCDCDECNF